jgi:predicted protein tyrosine phosphatase
VRHVLFICSRNQLRSPTAEQVFSSWPGIEVSSAGLDAKCKEPVTPELLARADVIFVMDILCLAGPFTRSAFARHRRIKGVTLTVALRCPAPLRPSPDSCPVVRRMRLTLTDFRPLTYPWVKWPARQRLYGPASRAAV